MIPNRLCYIVAAFGALIVVGIIMTLGYMVWQDLNANDATALVSAITNTPVLPTEAPVSTNTSMRPTPTLTLLAPTRVPLTLTPVATATPVATWHEIARWEDDDIWSAATDGYIETRSFRILSDEWRISWETWPDPDWGEATFWFFTCDGTGEPIEKSVETGGRDKGVITFDRGGRFSLAIGTLQPYRIVVEARF